MSEASADPLQLEHDAAIQQVVFGREPIDQKLLLWSDWLNPILVKESRQALKSRQFQWTFILLLLAVIGWTTIGVALMMPGIYYLPGGPTLMFGYFLILLAPACVMVPMSAFRSMAAELDEGTHDILSLSALNSRQIVFGKLSVAMLQAMIYFSAITPCIAITYLLRGLSISSIFIIIAGTFTLSVLFTSIAILFATLGRTRELQVLMTLILFAAFVPSLFGFIGFVGEVILSRRGQFSDSNAWLGSLAFFSVGFAYAWLALICASAKIGFAAENHSHRIRRVLFFHHCMILALGVFTTQVLRAPPSAWIAFIAWLAVHWGVCGTVMIGERGDISPRARRNIPTSFAGRLLLSFFNPGGGPGYFLAVGSMVSACMFIALVSILPWKLREHQFNDAFRYACAVTAYVALYLGFLRMLSLALGRNLRPRMALLFAFQVLIVALGVGISLFIPAWRSDYMSMEFDYYCFPNFFWTLIELMNHDANADAAMLIVYVLATFFFFANLFLITKDVYLIRVLTPPRVREEIGTPAAEEKAVDPFAD